MSVTVREYYSKKLKKKTYGYEVEVIVDGIRRFENKKGFATKTEAKKEGKALELQFKKKVEEGDNIEELIKKDKSKLTLHELMDLWLNSKKLTIKPTTLETYTNYCGMIKTVFKDEPIKKINAELIETRLNGLVGTNVKNGTHVNKNKIISATTIRHYYNTLHMAFEFAVKRSYIKNNPCKKIDRPKKEQKEMQYYKSEEIFKLLDNITGYSSYMPVLLSLTTGMRQAEIAALTWDNVDLENGFIKVDMQIQKIGDKLEELSLKSSSSYRTIAMFDYTIEALRKHRAAQEGVISNLKYVCSNADGSPYNPDTLGSNYRRLMKVYNLCDRLGLKYIRFHDLRHSHASFLIANKVSDKIISERLGHSDVRITLNTYSHINELIQKEAIKGIEFMKR
jgi:integrase